MGDHYDEFREADYAMNKNKTSSHGLIALLERNGVKPLICSVNKNKASPKYRKVATLYHPHYGYEIKRTIFEYDDKYFVDAWGQPYKWEWVNCVEVFWL